MRKSIIILMTIAIVTSGEVTINITTPILPEPKNAFKFEDQPDSPQSYGLIRFEDNEKYGFYNALDEENNQKIKFVEDNKIENQRFEDNEKYGFYNGLDKDNNQRIKFGEDNGIENQRPNPQKKKRRRRKPKQRFPSIQNGGVPGALGPGPYPVPGGYPGPIYPGQIPYPQPMYPGQFYRPRPSPTSAALSAVTEALSSIALYDDRQCVPRLLCEAAGGAGAGGAPAAQPPGGLLQAVSGMQPLLTLLAAYNGISTSPLFVFGRAVFLGMTSKANPGTCRYAYPDCPNDPEQLVHYLNNHNGGFFRFFAAPQLNQQQGLEQFYNQLSGQNYGYYQPDLQQSGFGQQQQNLQQFAQIQPGYPNQNQQGYGLYQQQNLQTGYGQFHQPNFGNFQNSGHQRPGLYGNSYGFYGNGYPYQQVNNNRFKNNEIQKRIQNTRSVFASNNNVGVKWLFPEDSSINNKKIYSNIRLGKELKFPQSNVNSVNTAGGFVFPGIQSNRDYTVNNIEAEDDNGFINDKPIFVSNNKFANDNKIVRDGKYFVMNDGVRTLYIVRGNGDPNHPEIVHLGPGQSL